jgi:ATP-dependent protease ClpP protease subunit
MTFTETKEKTELVQFCDHIIIHQPTPEQWGNAYDLMTEAKERAKAKAKAEPG